MNSRILLMVDVSNIAYKSAATNPNLSSEGVFTGGLYGFIGAVAKAIHQTGATSICCCEDRKPYIRLRDYPEYKSVRKANKDPVLKKRVDTTVALIRELCAVLGWPVWSVPAFECDDLIARAVIHYRHRYEKIVAMCNDSDMYQLFRYSHFEMYKGKKGLYTREDFDYEWKGLAPSDLVVALALTGTHNDVEGIFGIGPVGAVHAVKNPKVLDALIAKHGEIISRNKKLIELPHSDFPQDARMPLKGEFDERRLQIFLSRYGIKLERWISENFEGVK